MVSVFFVLEKANDTTWKYGNMKDLHDMDLRGCLPLFIQNFLLLITILQLITLSPRLLPTMITIKMIDIIIILITIII